ncbi:MAG: hypothetical protein ACK5DD_12210 [Cyclobacteriaceae bacterium]|jgi:hypothetical protein
MASRISKAIVHQYYKKETSEATELLKIDPIHYTAVRIILPVNGERSAEEIEVGEHYAAELPAEGFVVASPLEFHLYLNGVA